jgi:hypothetical protein
VESAGSQRAATAAVEHVAQEAGNVTKPQPVRLIDKLAQVIRMRHASVPADLYAVKEEKVKDGPSRTVPKVALHTVLEFATGKRTAARVCPGFEDFWNKLPDLDLSATATAEGNKKPATATEKKAKSKAKK